MNEDDFWDEDDPIFKMMKDMIKKMEKLFGDMGMFDEKMFSGKPTIRGFSITIGPDGVPKIREFGPGLGQHDQPIKEEKRKIEPDIIEKEDEYMVILDLPGIDKNTIKLKLDKNQLIIKAEGARKVYEYVTLPLNIKGSIDRFDYNNGVLTIYIKKKKGFKIF